MEGRLVAESMGRPSLEQLQKELDTEQKKHRRNVTIRNTIFFLSVVSATVVLLVVFLLPVLQVEGSSMAPTLQNGDVAISVAGSHFSSGDVIAFYRNNTVLIKRVVAVGGDWVDIDADGVVYVNEQALTEPYVTERALGNCDVSFPLQVPADQYFVLGDHRPSSVDSRSSKVGCVSEDMIIGRIVMRIWPLRRIGLMKDIG